MKLLFILLSALRVAFVGDPQVDNATELSYARSSIYSELRARKDLDLVVVLGDLVNDNPSLIAPSVACLDSLPCPWICAPGNHDKDVYRGQKRPRDLQTFRSVLGYSDTTFVMGGVRFISFDNVRTVQRGGYDGGLSESQKQWLSNVLTQSSEPVVLCAHIPFTECVGRDSLQAIIGPHASRMLMMVGHTHWVERKTSFFGCEEVQAGATCGTWWRGVKDARGIPYALMNCGAPRGYYIADFKPSRKQWYSLEYKCVGRPASDVASAFLLDGKLVINVYGASKEDTLEARIGGRWVPLQRSAEVAPEVQEIIQLNLDTTREYRRAHKDEFIPMRRLASPHMWELDCTTGIPSALKVRYRDSNMKFKSRINI